MLISVLNVLQIMKMCKNTWLNYWRVDSKRNHFYFLLNSNVFSCFCLAAESFWASLRPYFFSIRHKARERIGLFDRPNYGLPSLKISFKSAVRKNIVQIPIYISKYCWSLSLMVNLTKVQQCGKFLKSLSLGTAVIHSFN